MNCSSSSDKEDNSSSAIMSMEGSSSPASSPTRKDPSAAAFLVLPSPIKNRIANISSQKDDPNYDKEIVGEDGASYIHYTDFTEQKALTFEIPVVEVSKIIGRNETDLSCFFRKSPLSPKMTDTATAAQKP
jgi:hypothetical protein